MRHAFLIALIAGLTLSLIAACGGGGSSGGGNLPPVDTPLPDSSYTITTTPLVQFGTTGNNLAEKVVQDSTGKLVVVGTVTNSIYTTWTTSKGAIPVLAQIEAGDANGISQYDAFAARVDETTGNVEWLSQIDVHGGSSTEPSNGTSTDEGYGVALDANDNVYVVGSNNAPHTFAVKLNADGTETGFKKIFGLEFDFSEGFAVAIDDDADQYLFVAGYNTGPVGFPGDVTAYVARLNLLDLSLDDVVEFPSPATNGESWINSLSIDKSTNRFYIVGGMDTVASGVDTFVATVDYSGAAMSVSNGPFVTGLAGYDEGFDIAVHSSGIYTVGRLDQTSGLVTGVVGPAGYIMKNLNADATYDWIEEIGSSLPDVLSGVAVHNDGTNDIIHAVGNTDGAVADQPAASGTAALTVLRDSVEDLGYDLLDSATSEELYRGLTLTGTGDAFVFGETNGSVHGGLNLPGFDVFLSTYTNTKN